VIYFRQFNRTTPLSDRLGSDPTDARLVRSSEIAAIWQCRASGKCFTKKQRRHLSIDECIIRIAFGYAGN
jgi:hypothetical protein